MCLVGLEERLAVIIHVLRRFVTAEPSGSHCVGSGQFQAHLCQLSLLLPAYRCSWGVPEESYGEAVLGLIYYIFYYNKMIW